MRQLAGIRGAFERGRSCDDGSQNTGKATSYFLAMIVHPERFLSSDKVLLSKLRRSHLIIVVGRCPSYLRIRAETRETREDDYQELAGKGEAPEAELSRSD